jgi:hypothetical protein
MADNSTTKKVNWQAILAAMIIVMLPALSLVMNFKGAQQGRTFYQDLKDSLGVVSNISATDWFGESITSEKLKSNVLIISSIDDESKETVADAVKMVCKTLQFREDIDNLRYLTFDNTADSTFTQQLGLQFNPRDKELWHLLRGGNIAGLTMPNAYSVALVDTVGVIRRYYDMRNETDKKKLVEHIAVMPIRKAKNKVVKKEQKQM